MENTKTQVRKDIKNMTTLCYIQEGEKYLMLHKTPAKNDGNAGKWVGVGGHFKEGESPKECLLREVMEETGLTLLDFKLRGIVTFVSDKWGSEYMYLYTASKYSGKMQSCVEMNEGVLSWVNISEVKNLNLWEGDKIFLDLLLTTDRFFELKLNYRGDELISSDVNMY